MIVFQNSGYRGPVRLTRSPLQNFELVSPEKVTVAVGDSSGELVDLVEMTEGLRWEDQREVPRA